MTEFMPNLCDSCQRRTGPTTCEAFPVAIPDPILRFGVSHLGPVEGDGGKQFLLAEGAKAWDDFQVWESAYA